MPTSSPSTHLIDSSFKILQHMTAPLHLHCFLASSPTTLPPRLPGWSHRHPAQALAILSAYNALSPAINVAHSLASCGSWSNTTSSEEPSLTILPGTLFHIPSCVFLWSTYHHLAHAMFIHLLPVSHTRMQALRGHRFSLSWSLCQ